MHCPLCAGTLTQQDADLFTCDVGHELSTGASRRQATTRATVALWMAIEALGTEATALRGLVKSGGDGAVLESMAAQADEDARLLRELARAHTPAVSDAATALDL